MMDLEHWRRVETLFETALEMADSEREGFLASACVGNDDLLAEVRSLLEADRRADEVFLPPEVRDLASTGEDPRLGQRCGNYVLKEQIGSGGMGAVYLGVREDNDLRRRVAIKVIRAGMATARLVRRFELERRALAGLDHPTIARFLDGGRTVDGLPFLAMEYVEGKPLDTYCEEHALSLSARVELFRSVCSGVGYAHRKLVVHRDIKPRNILVTAEGVPKLLDFGIAKILDLEDGPLETTATQLFLSPEHASPEQIRGEPISTATDVYSLGVTLYELLTGGRPYCVTGRSRSEMERIICERDPIRPSAAIPDSDGRNRRRRRELSGDLDTIVLTALRKEPDKRYASVGELSEDLRRWLAGLPVSARKPTLRYRVGKFVRRHKGAVGATALLVLTIFVGTAVVVREARHARAEAAATRRVLSYLDGLFADLDPRLGGSVVELEDILDRSGERVDDELSDVPEAQGMLAERIAMLYRRLGLRAKATLWLEQAVAIYRMELGAGHQKVGDALHGLGSAMISIDPVRAERHLREALAIRIDAYGTRSGEAALTTRDLGGALWRQGRFHEAEELLRKALRIGRLAYTRNSPDLVSVLQTLASFLLDTGGYGEAELLAREALAMAERQPPPYDARFVMNTLAGILQDTGQYVEAETLFRERLDVSREKFDDDHQAVVSDRINLALLLRDTGRIEAAEGLCRDALDSLSRKPEGSDVFVRGDAWSALAKILRDKGELRDAESAGRRAIALARNATYRAERTTLVAEILVATGRADEAEPLMREAWDTLGQTLTADSWRSARAASVLGAALAGQGRFDEAEPLLVDSHPVIRGDRGPKHARTRESLSRIVALYDAWGRPERAAAYRDLAADRAP